MRFTAVVCLALFCGTRLFADPCSKAWTPAEERIGQRSNAVNNPLLQKSTLDHGAFPFDKLRLEHFKPALTMGLRMTKTRLDLIRKNPLPPTYENTIEALEASSEPLDQASKVLSLYGSVMNSPEIEELQSYFNPIISEFSVQLATDMTLFERVQAVYNQRDVLHLNIEQQKILEDTYRSFIRNGVNLSSEQKKRISEISAELTNLGQQFGKNILDSTNAYTLTITDKRELNGLPESLIDMAAQEAEKRGKPGSWVFTLKGPSVGPFLSYANNRGRREQMLKAYWSVAEKGETNNVPKVLRIAQLRLELAQLLRYENHAALKLEDRMAKDARTVDNFLESFADIYRPHALRERQELKQMAPHKLEPWDQSYYREKLRELKYSYRSEDLRPYFRFDRVVQGAFYVANRLYGVTFSERADLPTWHPSVKVYEVKDKAGEFLALYYLDPFPRESKQGGAWMTEITSGGLFDGVARRPHVLNVGNMTPPVGDQFAQLSLGDVYTLFHELGHGLHSMLSRVRSASLFGTSVAWDFVELPSQLFENWVLEPEVLDVYALHKDTGERIPDGLVEKVKRSEKFMAASNGLSYVMMSKIDMAWHTQNISELSNNDVEAWEDHIAAPYRVTPKSSFSGLISTTFSHIFDGGYAAGYYSYKWADVLAADAFELFKENGVFNPEIASRFLTSILERGGSEDADVLYRRFRGRDADPGALARREGLQ